ncbi:hypothetical protein TKK_0016449 [Trichogramma kaykai]
MIQATVQMSQRCKFEDDKFSSLTLFHPENALNKEFHEHVEKNGLLFPTFERFKSLQPFHEKEKVMKTEWDDLIKYDLPGNITNEKDMDKFWFLLKEVGDGKFEHLSEFVLNLLCIPNSNAGAERIWSKYKLEKSDIRSSLHNESTPSIMLTSALIQDVGGVKNLEIPDDVIYSLHDESGNLWSKKKPQKEEIKGTFGIMTVEPVIIDEIDALLFGPKYSAEDELHKSQLDSTIFQHKCELSNKVNDTSDCNLEYTNGNSVCNSQNT